MPTQEEIAAPSAAVGDNLTTMAQATNAPAASSAATGKKRGAMPMKMAAANATTERATKSRKGAGAAKTQNNHPSYGNMIKAALSAIQDKKGSSRAAILKYIMQHYQVGENPTLVNAHLRMGLKRGVAAGTLKQLKGTGASGSFRLAEGKPEPTKKIKKPAAKKNVAAGDMKMPTPKKSTRAKSALKKAAASKASKPKAAPKKKTNAASGGAAVKKGKKSGASAGAGGKKTKAASSQAKSKATKKPVTHARTKKVAAS